MERFDSGGNRIPLGPGEVAAVDQVHKLFEDTASKLLNIREQVAALVLAPEPGDNQEILRLNQELHELVAEVFGHGTTGGANVYSFVMFLIDTIANQKTLINQVADKINQAGNVLADALDLVVPVTPIVTPIPGLQPDGSYITGIGQVLENIHDREVCTGWCVIHNPIPGPWDDWPTVWRGDGLGDIWRGFERNCPHGKGHRAVEEILMERQLGLEIYPHGCCGICKCSPLTAEPIFDPDTRELKGYK